MVSKRTFDIAAPIGRAHFQRELQHDLPDYLKQHGNYIWFHQINKLENLLEKGSVDISMLTGLKLLQNQCINVRPILKGGICLVTVTFCTYNF
jgi:hypothetical protein